VDLENWWEENMKQIIEYETNHSSMKQIIAKIGGKIIETNYSFGVLIYNLLRLLKPLKLGHDNFFISFELPYNFLRLHITIFN